MSILNNIAYFQNRRDEVPNQELARELAEFKNEAGIREIAENLWHQNQHVQSDCLKVLYEIGYLNPELIAPYAGDFVKLLRHKNNRLVWGSMIALSTIAEFRAGELYPHVEEIKQVMAQGSVITIDNGVKTLAGIASTNDDYNRVIFPYLIHHLQTCRSKEIPQHSEKTLVAVNAANKETFITILEMRMAELTAPQLARVKKVIKEAQKR
jgi:hypothetical protein